MFKRAFLLSNLFAPLSNLLGTIKDVNLFPCAYNCHEFTNKDIDEILCALFDTSVNFMSQSFLIVPENINTPFPQKCFFLGLASARILIPLAVEKPLPFRVSKYINLPCGEYGYFLGPSIVEIGLQCTTVAETLNVCSE